VILIITPKTVGNAVYIRHLRAKAVAEGKCSSCRARPAKEGRKSCQECIDNIAARKAAHYATSAGRGMCSACTQPALEGLRQCAKHHAKHSADHRRRTEKRLAAGLCSHCDSPLQTATLCAKHARKMRQRVNEVAQRRIAAGLCRYCETPRDERSTETMCGDCADRLKVRSRVRSARLRVEQDRADELLALSYGAIAARGR
jgi:hypothetical protein